MLATLALVLAPQAPAPESRHLPVNRLSGRAVSADASPLAGVEVELWTRKPRGSVVRGRAHSGADGGFVVDVLPLDLSGPENGSFLVLSCTGLAPSVVDGVFLPPPSHDLGSIALYPPVELRGRVLDG